MSKIFTANRVAAIATWLTGLSALIAAIVGTFPQSWQNVALAVAGVALKGVTALHFMTGSQKFDALTTTAPIAATVVHPVAPPLVSSAIEAAVAALPDPVVAPVVPAPVVPEAPITPPVA